MPPRALRSSPSGRKNKVADGSGSGMAAENLPLAGRAPGARISGKQPDIAPPFGRFPVGWVRLAARAAPPGSSPEEHPLYATMELPGRGFPAVFASESRRAGRIGR
ncbi:hypothetical protein GCM10009727_35690 [Actinomadura napierensis]|uniref:DUF397 domain-containing protein n=1 Tax=Actinomadura napierensis TaxID=267854 RepID=A0ABP5L170_9ACTN